MTKKEIIEKVNGAINRILKDAGESAAVSAALDVVSEAVTKAKAAVSTGVLDYERLHKNLRACFAILDSICMGYPMVPAGGLDALTKLVKGFRGATEKKFKVEEFIEFAVSEVEKAAKFAEVDKASPLPADVQKRAQIVPRLMVVKAAMFAWEQMPEGETILPITIIDVSDNTSTTVPPENIGSPGAGNYGFAKGAVDRVEAIKAAFGATPPPKDTWPRDLTITEVQA